MVLKSKRRASAVEAASLAAKPKKKILLKSLAILLMALKIKLSITLKTKWPMA